MADKIICFKKGCFINIGQRKKDIWSGLIQTKMCVCVCGRGSKSRNIYLISLFN